ncbi:aspartyl-phosphate phosphatase Spo0E family protein [Paenibacillus sp. JX-17]|uniref:Aspartyl-phosphate phosphatase Spo0E family protein n=1 Tax=Paenibacillus lacisoli TaxID=3064525 RepID=A0ABT9CAV9_9BACL|nr:aspartyl-phosphate phosphatase Spo0E family protein [Paenibacillus sp. JX-17]MDO7906393.1 aspartyl-phosphate phosphatase Spo0E family protein [Paenibacillus sp. JX-17]
MNLKEIEKLMEQERRELNRMADQHGLKDGRVLDKSSQLDRIIDIYSRIKRSALQSN